MKSVYDLTIDQVAIPTGRSITEEELDIAERALSILLSRYENDKLKADLRVTLKAEAEKEYAFITDYQLMRASELYRLIDAAKTLGAYLHHNTMRRLEKRAAAGDEEAAADLKAIKG